MGTQLPARLGAALSGLESEDGHAIGLKPVVIAGFVQARTTMLRVEKKELLL
jgi:hypothetical protein